jgi:hypothetical protein
MSCAYKVHGRMDGQTDGRTDGQTVGRTDRRPSIRPSICMSFCPFVRLSVHLSVRPSIGRPSVDPFVRRSILGIEMGEFLRLEGTSVGYLPLPLRWRNLVPILPPANPLGGDK